MAQQPSAAQNLADARRVLTQLSMPRAQQNERSALSLLALLDPTPDRTWSQATNPLVGITPILDWARQHYGKDYKWGSRETVRRQTMHQFVEAGIALYNPDQPNRPVNSPKAVYQITPEALALMRVVGTEGWRPALKQFLETRETLVARYARIRDMNLVPVTVADGKMIRLSAGEHSKLIKAIVEDFLP